jgi:hypothetical protein
MGPNWVGFYLRMETESSLRNVLNKNKTMNNIKKSIIALERLDLLTIHEFVY